MTDQPAEPTILDRLSAAYGEDKAAALLASGDVQLDGEPVSTLR